MELKEHIFFESFYEPTVIRLIEAAQTMHCEEHEVVFSEGDDSDSIYLILSGHVEIQKSDPAGGHQAIAYLGPNEYFGEFGILDGQPRSAGALTTDKATLVRLSQKALFDAFRESPEACVMGLANQIINKFRHSNDRVVEERLRRERQSMVGQMANEIIHDFKNPFTVICIAASAMKSKYTDEMTQKYCQLIEDQIRRMQVMADELLEFSRGKTTLHIEEVSIKKLMERFQLLNEDYLAQADIELTVQTPEGVIEADEDKLLRVLQNLANNAADSMQGKPGHISVEVRVGRKELQVFVKDDGPGIPEEIQANLFEAFATFGKKKGLGLGMAITKSVIEAHRGDITFETEIGRGTVFKVVLPLKHKKKEDE